MIREQAAVVGEAKAANWPNLTITAQELNERTGYPDSTDPSNTRTGNVVYGTFDWRLFDFGGRSANRRAAQAQLEAAIASRDATVQKVLGSVVQSYFGVITASGLLRAKREETVAARETLASAQRRNSAGTAGQSDVLQGQTALAKTTLTLNQAQAMYDKSVAQLMYLLGLSVECSVQLPEELDTVGASEDENLSKWLADAQRHHPAIAGARASLDAAREHVAAVRSIGLPTVDVTANYYQNGFPNQGLNNINSRVATVGLSITVPVFDGWATHEKVDEARALVTVKEAELADTEQAILESVIAAYADAQSALRNLRASEDLLLAAQQSFESSQRRYLSGAGDIIELLATQSARADAKEQRVRSLAEWHAARLVLLASGGRLDRRAVEH